MLPSNKFITLMVLFSVGRYCESRLSDDGHMNKISRATFALLECSKHANRVLSQFLWDKNFPPVPMCHFLRLHHSAIWQWRSFSNAEMMKEIYSYHP